MGEWSDDGRDGGSGSSPAFASLHGETIDGRYRIVGELGRGGMGTVYEAIQTGVDRRIAVKVVNAVEGGVDEPLLRRFEREAKIIANLKHPNIVTLFDSGRLPDGRLYIAMELVEGLTLRDVLRAEKALPATRAIDIALQTSQALADAHDQGIVHRDLKPSNIVIANGVEGHRDWVKVLDFGIAKVVEYNESAGRLTGSKTLGTPRYMSPEQIRGLDDLDARSDVYALGLIVYEMLTGRPTFSAPNEASMLYQHLHEVPPSMGSIRPDFEIDPALDALVLRCVAKARDERPADARSFARHLAALRTETAPALLPTTTMESPAAAPRDEITRAEGRRTRGAESEFVADDTKVIEPATTPMRPMATAAITGSWEREKRPRSHLAKWLAGAFVLAVASAAVLIGVQLRQERMVGGPDDGKPVLQATAEPQPTIEEAAAPDAGVSAANDAEEVDRDAGPRTSKRPRRRTAGKTRSKKSKNVRDGGAKRSSVERILQIIDETPATGSNPEGEKRPGRFEDLFPRK